MGSEPFNRLGMGVVILLYVGINAVFVFAAPLSEMSGVMEVADLAAANLFGSFASRGVSFLVALSILGALNSLILIGPRIYYAMAQDGLFFQRVGSIHPRFKTPAASILLQSLWATVLILTGTFGQLLNYVTFVILLFSCLTGAAVFVIRHRFSERDRPFSMWGYPWIPLLFIGISLWIMGNVLVTKPLEALAGLGFVSLGIPVYFYWRRKLKGENYVQNRSAS
ncbi:MAG: amino acid permease [Deltaproteobacteria bacterium]|nr:amino acid permease [Deltaproteobacteria bacterium]